MKRSDIALGDRVKCSITGFQGVVTAKIEYLNGCLRFEIQPEELDKEGKYKSGMILDAEQLKLVKAGVHTAEAPGGGPALPSLARPALARR